MAKWSTSVTTSDTDTGSRLILSQVSHTPILLLVTHKLFVTIIMIFMATILATQYVPYKEGLMTHHHVRRKLD